MVTKKKPKAPVKRKAVAEFDPMAAFEKFLDRIPAGLGMGKRRMIPLTRVGLAGRVEEFRPGSEADDFEDLPVTVFLFAETIHGMIKNPAEPQRTLVCLGGMQRDIFVTESPWEIMKLAGIEFVPPMPVKSR